MDSPFVFGKIARGNHFINRTAEIAHLSTNFTSGVNTMIVSPRRWGKSSLVVRSAEKVERRNKDIRFCYMDLFKVRDEKHFFEVLAESVLRASSGRWQEWVNTAKELLAGIVSSISIGTDPVNDFSLKLSWEKGERDEKSVLDLPEMIARKRKIRLVICMDEFQKIAEFRESRFLQQRLRAHWQAQSNVSYCLYGSKRHVITELFTSPSQPFYQFGDLVFLQKIEASHWFRYIQKQFRDTGKQIDRHFIDKIIRMTDNHPYHIQQLAHHIWRQSEKEVSEEVFDSSVNELLLNNEILFKKEIDSLTSLQLKFLEAKVAGEQHMSSSETIARYDLGSPGNLNTIRKALESKEILDFYEKEPGFVNPLFEFWLRERFFK